jgi:small subunit ribosomal protein S6
LKKYEAMFILDEHLVEDQGNAFSEEFKKLAEGLGSKIDETLPMGKRQFTYEVKKKKAGIYWDFMMTAEPNTIQPIKNKYRLDERILRMRIFEIDDRKGKKF